MSNEPGFIYLVYMEPYYLLGAAVDVEDRLRLLRPGFHHHVVHTLAVMDMHRAIGYFYRRFETKKLSGHWYALSDDDVRELCALRSDELDEGYT